MTQLHHDNSPTVKEPLSSSLSRRRRGNERFFCAVLEAIARCAQYDVPVPPALRALAETAEFRRSSMRAHKHRERVLMMAADLEAGLTLGEAFLRHFSASVTPAFLEALSIAEANGTLRETLPVLASTNGLGTAISRRFREALLYPVVQGLAVFTVLSGLFVFIVPKFGKMFDEMAPGHRSIHLSVMSAVGDAVAALWSVLLLVGVAYCIVRLLLPYARTNDSVMNIIEMATLPVPFLGTIIRRRAMLEASQAMASLTAAGAALDDACETAVRIARSPRAARGLLTFQQQLCGGKAWADAWNEAVSPPPLCAWFMVNSATREDPTGGFLCSARWLARDIDRRLASVERWAEPAGILTNCALGAFAAYGLLGTLFSIVWHAM